MIKWNLPYNYHRMLSIMLIVVLKNL